jgi:PAS domain S-box-containing protein
MTATILSRVPVAKKLLLLVLIPCFLQAFFVCVLAGILQNAQHELRVVEHQRNALISLKAAAGEAILALMRIQDTREKSKVNVHEELAKLNKTFMEEGGIVTDLTAENYPELKEIIEDANAMQGDVEALLQQAQENINKVNPKTGKKIKRTRLVERTLLVSTILNCQSIAKRIIDAEGSTKISDVERINALQKSVNVAIFTVLGINALITLSFLYLFTSDIAARLRIVAENTHKLTFSKSALEPCPGDDEIAALDAALKKVAEQLEEFRKRKLAILENAIDVVFTLDDKFRVAAVNAASRDNWGLTAEELLGLNFLSLFTPEYRESIGSQISAFAADEADSVKTIEAAIAVPSGVVKTFEITLSKTSESSGFTGVARDITQQKAVAELKERLLAIVSHDLRTPLASLSITMSVIVEGKRIADPELQKSLASIDASIQSVMALTHDLLSLEKQEAELATIGFSPVKAYNVWLQVKSVLQPLCKERNVALKGPDADVQLLANEEKLVQAVSIIARTVLNFAAVDAELNFVIEKDDHFGRIGVSTNRLAASAGNGREIAERLSDVDEEHIFDSENISLAIARAIVDKHRGQLLFASVENGFAITVQLPAAEEVDQ